MKFCEYIYKRLNSLEYNYVFGVPGSYIMPLWQSFKGEPQIILGRHESGAAFMADGWARLTGKPGVVISTAGPGITNIITGVASAYKDSIPMIVLTGQARTDMIGKGVFQESSKNNRGFDPVTLLTNVTKGSWEIKDIKNAVSIFENALKLAMTRRKGPVHVSLPFDIQLQDIKEDNENTCQTIYDNNFIVDYSYIINKIKSAKRTLLIVGWGCYLSDCSDEIDELSLILGAPIVTTVKGLSAISLKIEMFVGHIGYGQKKETLNFVNSYSPDLILILGASLSSYYSENIQQIINNACCIQVDIENKQIGYYKSVDYGYITNNLKDWTTNLNSLLKKNRNWDREIKESVIEFRNSFCSCKYLEKFNKAGLMARTINKLNTLLDENTLLLPDAGNHWLNALTLYYPKKVRSFFANIGLGSMGYAIGASIGMKLAKQNYRVVCITGDASVLMYGNEISVSVDQGLNNIFIIYNNSSMGRIRVAQKLDFGENYIATDINECNFAKWAEGLGAESYRVNTEQMFDDAVHRALSSNNTVVIEVIVDKEEIPICLLDK